MQNEDVIRFENLRQRSSAVVGEDSVVKAKAKPFVSSNAHGVLREVQSMGEVRKIAQAAADKTLTAIKR